MVFANEHWARLRKQFDSDSMTEREIVLAHIAKLSEETGELTEQILASQSLQRNKDKNFSLDALGEEIADVMIVTLIIARHLDIDVNKSLAKKIKKIEARYN